MPNERNIILHNACLAHGDDHMTLLEIRLRKKGVMERGTRGREKEGGGGGGGERKSEREGGEQDE